MTMGFEGNLAVGLLALQYAIIGDWLVCMIFHILGHLSIRKRYAKQMDFDRLRKRKECIIDGVTIVRPICGMEEGLLENLMCSFDQTYQQKEIILAAERKEDIPWDIIKKLEQGYPNADWRVVIAGEKMFENPKVSNMKAAFDVAKYDMVWVCDSNARSDLNALENAVEIFENDSSVGVVHHLIWAVDANTIGGAIETAFLNSTHARMYLAINSLKLDSCLTGKSNFYRISSLEKFGGIAAFGKYIAEDNMIGQKLWRDGLAHRMTYNLALTSVKGMSLSSYFKRRIRWVRVRVCTVPGAVLLEPFTESVVVGVLTSLALNSLYGVPKAQFLIWHFLLWFISDFMLFLRQRKQTEGGIPKLSMQLILSYFIRELSALPVWIIGISGNTASWRDKLYKINFDGSINAM